jgi:hypothetical protein
MRSRRRTLQTAALPLAIVWLALVALAAAKPINASSPGPTSGTWSGTVQWSASLAGDTLVKAPDGSTATVHVERQEQATYSVTAAPGGSAASSEADLAAQMNGSAEGSISSGRSSTFCTRGSNPFYAWSYQGPAQISISYSNGSFVMQPQPVSVSTATVDNGCGSSDTPRAPFTAQVPGGFPLGAPAFAAQQAVAASATSLSGSVDVPWVNVVNGQQFPLGTVTISWDLQRQLPAAPPPSPPPAPPSPPAPAGAPSGVASGSVLVNGVAFSSGSLSYGSRVDVTNGTLQLTTRAGSLRVFGGGVTALFVLAKSSQAGKPLDVLRLVGGDFSVCDKQGFRVVSRVGKKKPPAKVVRRLWAQGKGSFQTRGRYSYTTVRGTYWLTADRCDGTLTQVKQGTVDVLDLPHRKHVTVTTGKSYIARRP